MLPDRRAGGSCWCEVGRDLVEERVVGVGTRAYREPMTLSTQACLTAITAHAQGLAESARHHLDRPV